MPVEKKATIKKTAKKTTTSSKNVYAKTKKNITTVKAVVAPTPSVKTLQEEPRCRCRRRS
jgi:hypothetical protein